MVLMLLRTRLSAFSMTAPFLNALISALFYAAESCLALKLTSNHSDGLQQIHLESIGWVPVLCDQQTNSGGWTILQRRTRPFTRVNFDRNWTDYEAGFGNIQEGNFWLGNKMIHMLMKTPRFLRIELRTDRNENGFSEYSDVKVNGVANKYRLQMASPNGYRGSIGDCGGSSSWQYFTTKDSDNDKQSNINCAVKDGAGWWYKNCGCGNLNKKEGPKWNSWTPPGNFEFSEMKIRWTVRISITRW